MDAYNNNLYKTVIAKIGDKYPDKLEAFKQNYALIVESRLNKNGGKKMIKIYKDGDRMGIETDCSTSEELFKEFSNMADSMAEKWENDLSFQYGYLLPMLYQIALSLDGYKSDVSVRKISYIGDIIPTNAVLDNIKVS